MVQIKNLSFSYSSGQALFDGLDLTLPPGYIYGLLGKNGAGKSSLLKIMTGLLFPQQGSLNVAGFRPGDRFPAFLREIYLLPEEFDLPPLTMNGYVRLYSPFYPRFDPALFDTYCKEFDLQSGQKLRALSYGQKKKFLLAFGLATDCKLLILDEPVNGLDIPSKRQFRKVVAHAIHEERSFLISTHQARDMENLIDPIIVLDAGKIIFFQDVERISQKLAITRHAELPDSRSTVYYESSLGGHTVVQENTSGEEAHINLEILFNAVVSNPEKINQLFNPARHESEQLF